MNDFSRRPVIVVTSGGFDPLHIGHVRLMEEARKLGDKLIVVVNGDGWLERKKGHAFMPAEERLEIIKALRCVDEVMLWDDGTSTVSGALELIKPDIFAKGGDRDAYDKIPEATICQKINCQIVFNVGGGKIQSSSWLLNKHSSQMMIQSAGKG